MARGPRGALICTSESAMDYGLLNDINGVAMPPNDELQQINLRCASIGQLSWALAILCGDKAWMMHLNPPFAGFLTLRRTGTGRLTAISNRMTFEWPLIPAFRNLETSRSCCSQISEKFQGLIHGTSLGKRRCEQILRYDG